MKSPKDQATIQIEITNACTHVCSNCTRFCGHHQKPYFMDFDTFRRAVDSLDGYEGTIGMMGGEPTLHPEFERFTEYLNQHIPPENRKTRNNFVYPQSDFMRSLRNQELENIVPINYATGRREAVRGAGLWSAMVPNFKHHYELIQDVYRKQVLNDHNNVMLHQPILISRKELGITDEEWIPLREKCWINQFWSASVTPKGCFFCEIAAAMDRLFQGPGGWPIEPGWWKREEADFEGQLHWCELCGIPLQTFTRDAREEIDDVSPKLYSMLERVGSPKLKKGQVNRIEIVDNAISEKSKNSVHEMRGEFYAESYYSRFNTSKSVLYPDGFELLVVGLPDTVHMDRIRSLLDAGVIKKAYIYRGSLSDAREDPALLPDSCMEEIEAETLGQALCGVLDRMNWNDYLFVTTDRVTLARSGIDKLSNCVVNPGTLHFIDFSDDVDRGDEYIEGAETMKDGIAVLLNKTALTLRRFGYDRLARLKDLKELKAVWPQNKVVEFSPRMDYAAPEKDIFAGKKYAIYGTGDVGELMIRSVLEHKAEVVCVVDSDSRKWGKDFMGYPVENPESLTAQRSAFDSILVASILYYSEIKDRLYDMGFCDRDLTMP